VKNKSTAKEGKQEFCDKQQNTRTFQEESQDVADAISTSSNKKCNWDDNQQEESGGLEILVAML